MKAGIAARRKARRFVLQALYQMELTGIEASDVEKEFIEEHNMKRSDTDYFHEVLSGIEKNRDEIDVHISSAIDRDISELGHIELSLLRMGVLELSNRIDIPFKVVINEHVDMAKSFGASESYRFINSVLDRLARTLRKTETTD